MCKVCEVGEVGGRVKKCERRRALSLFIKRLVFLRFCVPPAGTAVDLNSRKFFLHHRR